MPIEQVDCIWMDGEFLPWNEARIHVMTHGLHYGTGVFEGIRAYPIKSVLHIFRLEDHLQRLYRSAKIHKMDIPYSKDQLWDVILELIRKNRIKKNCYIRPLIYRGYGEFGLNPYGTPIKCAVITFPIQPYLKEEGVKICISSWRRIPDVCIPSAAKTCGSYVNSMLAKMEGLERGYDEAVMLNIDGHVAEGTGENIFLVKKGKIFTPALSTAILEGITRRSVIELAREEGFDVFEKNLLRSELFTCDEAFFTGTAAEVTPILSVDDRLINDGGIGEVTEKLRNTFLEIVKGERADVKGWLTPIS